MAKKSNLPDLSARSNTYKSSAKLVNTRFYMIFGALLLSALLGLLGFVGNVLSSNDSIDLSSEIPKGRAEAQLVAEAFLSGKPYPIDYAKSFSKHDNEFFTKSNSIYKYDFLVWKGFKKNSYGEVHSFYIMRNNDNYIINEDKISNKIIGIELIVNLIIDNNNIFLASLPYIKKLEIPSTELTFDYGIDDNDISKLSNEALEKINQWATYYLSDDRRNLQLVTPDNRNDVEYYGIGDLNIINYKILSGVVLNVENNKIINYNDWLLRVRLTFNNNEGFTNSIDVDVTLTNAETAEPLIVAWGEAGTGVLPVGSNSREKR